jgi:Flp pilus assembly protein TadD
MRAARAAVLPLILASVLSACASPVSRPPVVPGRGSADPAADSTPLSSVGAEDSAAGSELEPRANPATTALLADSRRSRAAGDYSAAAISVERALSIDPNNAALWVELAEIRLAAGDRDQADSCARKALTLAGNDAAVTARAERVVGR